MNNVKVVSSAFPVLQSVLQQATIAFEHNRNLRLAAVDGDHDAVLVIIVLL